MQYGIIDGEITYLSTAVDPNNPTQAERDAAEPIIAAEVAAHQAKANQLATLREPVVVEGVTFPVLRADMGFYGATHAARNNPNMAYPLPLLGDDGVIVALDADDVDRVYNAILTAIATRASAQA
tara:strand:+ start:11810 stop:12184 length:375 start_codon:yes stop_codon:yes gene_type:complete